MPTLMAVGAHPDDIEIGFGATLRRCTREGHPVVAVDLTDGELTPYGNREIRKRESEAASAILGLSGRRCLDLPNRVLMDTVEAREALAAVMRETRPDIVVTHHPLDVHPDHAAAFAIARGAMLLSRIVKCDYPHDPWRPGRLYSFHCSHMKHVYDPAVVLRVEAEDFAAKMEAILAYESQFGKQYGGLDWLRNLITSRDRMYGALAGAEYGEALFSDEVVALPDLWSLPERGRSNAPGA